MGDLAEDGAAERPLCRAARPMMRTGGEKMFLIEVPQSARLAGMSCISVCLGSPTFENFNIHGESFLGAHCVLVPSPCRRMA